MKPKALSFKGVGMLFACAAWLLPAQPADAQPPKKVIDYKLREATAPARIKTQLTTLRKAIATNKHTFKVGYTVALDRPLSQLAGTRPPSDLATRMARQNTMATRLLRLDSIERDKFVKAKPGVLPELKIRCAANLAKWDWRKQGKVTPVRDQGACGSCWAFATIGAYEGSYAIRNGTKVDTSEQDVLNCSNKGSCKGGWWAFDYVIRTGVASEASYPYQHADKPCKTGVSHSYHAVAWGYVGSSSGVPSANQLKSALCTYGPLAVAVRVTPAFQAYTGGVFNEKASGSVNHGVTLIGWDNTKGAWLIKNSWGKGWGETGGYGSDRGYMWIKYGSNSIGYAAAWVRARNRYYPLHKDFLKLVPRIKPNLPGVKTTSLELAVPEKND